MNHYESIEHFLATDIAKTIYSTFIYKHSLLPKDFYNYYQKYTSRELADIFNIKFEEAISHVEIVRKIKEIDDIAASLELYDLDNDIDNANKTARLLREQYIELLEIIFKNNDEEITENNASPFKDYINFIIFPDIDEVNFDSILEELYSSKSGKIYEILNKLYNSFQNFLKRNYTDIKKKGDLHVIKDNGGDNSINNISLQRFTSSILDKIAFLKLPLSNNNKQKLKEKYGVKELDSIYLVIDFGIIALAGISENSLYKRFNSNAKKCYNYTKYVCELTSSKDLSNESFEELCKIIENSFANIEGLGQRVGIVKKS